MPVQKSKKKCEKVHIWNSATFSCRIGRYAGSIIDNSMITCDEVIETTKSILRQTSPTKSHSKYFNEKKVICEMKTFYIFLALLITMTIAVEI